MISSFISLYSFKTLFIKKNQSWLTTESIKTLEIKASMLFNLDFAYNNILSCFFFFFIIINFLLIAAVIVQTFNPIAEVVIPIGIPTKEAKSGMETHPVIVEPKIRKCSI